MGYPHRAKPRDTSVIFIARVRALRKERGISATALATMITNAGFPAAGSAISQQEGGHRIRISLDQADATARALGLPLAELVTPPECGYCHGAPPQGFACTACGTAAPRPSPRPPATA